MDHFIDIGQEAHGVIAIGQVATGVVAIGQMAFGVIAIGQVARGVVAIGQASLGIFTVGMVSAGVGYCVALVGVGGVAGPGFVIPLVPGLAKRPRLPDTVSLAALRAGEVVAGWLRVRLEPVGEDVQVLHGADVVPMRFSRRVWEATRELSQRASSEALIWIERAGPELLCTRVMGIPPRPGWGCGLAIAQFIALCGLAVAFWLAVAKPLVAALVG